MCIPQDKASQIIGEAIKELVEYYSEICTGDEWEDWIEKAIVVFRGIDANPRWRQKCGDCCDCLADLSEDEAWNRDREVLVARNRAADAVEARIPLDLMNLSVGPAGYFTESDLKEARDRNLAVWLDPLRHKFPLPK